MTARPLDYAVHHVADHVADRVADRVGDDACDGFERPAEPPLTEAAIRDAWRRIDAQRRREDRGGADAASAGVLQRARLLGRLFRPAA